MKALFLIALLPLMGGHGNGDLPKPSARFDLPAELREISGLTDIDDHTVACLQDEAATLYLIDLRTGQVSERHPFGPPGDMEGLTRVGHDLYALRSDGLVYQLKRNGHAYQVEAQFNMRLPNNNIEGLGFDEHTGLVLVAPKDNLKGGPELRDRRSIYAFNPKTHSLLPKPVLTYSVQGILREAEAQGFKIPMRTTPKGRQVPTIKFRMSSIAINPATGNYCILSAVDQTLLVLDRKGAFVALYALDADLLPKPEGITFLANGDMLISSEGKDGPARLVRYPAFK